MLPPVTWHLAETIGIGSKNWGVSWHVMVMIRGQDMPRETQDVWLSCKIRRQLRHIHLIKIDESLQKTVFVKISGVCYQI